MVKFKLFKPDSSVRNIVVEESGDGIDIGFADLDGDINTYICNISSDGVYIYDCGGEDIKTDDDGYPVIVKD